MKTQEINLRYRRSYESLASYMSVVEAWIASQHVDVLHELCREHACNIEELAVAIVAKNEKRYRWSIEKELEAKT